MSLYLIMDLPQKTEIHFVSKSTKIEDIDIFFGPLVGNETIFEILSGEKLCHLMFRAGVFKSVSDARRNGFDLDIPYGYSEYKIGKLKKRIYILNL